MFIKCIYLLVNPFKHLRIISYYKILKYHKKIPFKNLEILPSTNTTTRT